LIILLSLGVAVVGKTEALAALVVTEQALACL